jgi:hypothetical protein
LKRGLLLFALVFSASCIFVFTKQQITTGIAEDHFEIGRSLARMGRPLPLFRPPGYPVFVAGAAWLCLHAGQGSAALHIRAVQVAQCLLLAGASVLLFLWMSQQFEPASCWTLALLFGVNPLMLVLAGFLHYDVLHLFLVVLSCYVASSGLRARRSQLRRGLTLVGGLLFGVTTIVRPLTLLLPLCVTPALLVAFRPRWRLGLALAALFAVGMAMGVFPVALRNYILTGRFIPVNAQGHIALWSATLKPRQSLDNRSVPWGKIWWTDGVPIFNRILGQPGYSDEVFKERILDLEDGFGRQAIDNIRREPHVYAGNVVRNAAFFLTGAPTGMIEEFVRQQPIADGTRRRHPGSGLRTLALSFELMFGAWLTLGLIGVGIAVHQRSVFAVLPAAVFLCLCMSHAATYVDFRYLYVKVPFLLVFCAYLTDTPRRIMRRFSPDGVSLGSALRVGLLALGVWTSAVVYYAT